MYDSLLPLVLVLFGIKADSNCSEQIVDFLLDAEASVDIFTACTFCMTDVVKTELKRDGSLVSERHEGSTPLNWAVRPRRNYDAAPEICKSLIAANADVHNRDNYECDMTPLHHTAEWGPRSACNSLTCYWRREPTSTQKMRSMAGQHSSTQKIAGGAK